ncbi:hypothetical protein AT728_27355 [Streptomyces silvensis]|uniref:Uncharacterized protein n=1 Tax=Streptomyces silvensis TaxID=1765722 RepID=A0A0W7WXB8_9ACTN|nr:hypothetical protein AT728_27355 [Streptomyces silvensis]
MARLPEDGEDQDEHDEHDDLDDRDGRTTMTIAWHTLTPSQLAEQEARLLTLDDLQERWGVSSHEVHWLIMLRGLPTVLFDGTWRFVPEDVTAWAADNGGVPVLRASIREARERWRRAREDLDARGTHPALREKAGSAE